jgi:hypothetical protein
MVVKYRLTSPPHAAPGGLFCSRSRLKTTGKGLQSTEWRWMIIDIGRLV